MLLTIKRDMARTKPFNAITLSALLLLKLCIGWLPAPATVPVRHSSVQAAGWVSLCFDCPAAGQPRPMLCT